MSGKDKKEGAQGEQRKGVKDSKPGVASGHTLQASKATKRAIEEVANSSAEEIALLTTHMEELTGDMKQIKDNMNDLMKKSDEMMTKDDMKTFIKATIDEIMTEINKNMEVTIDIKIKEKTDTMAKEIEQLKKEIESVRTENNTLKKDLKEANKLNEETTKLAQQGLQKANQNEQYSRKNNVKILNIEEQTDEDEVKLINTVGELLHKQSVHITPAQIVAIHRIPGKSGTPKLVLIKFRNNSDKTRVMKTRAGMKATGNRLVDDVTKLNTTLISKLNDHTLIDSAWYFNGAIFGKTTSGKRLKFDMYDDIDDVISKADSKK